MALIFVVLTFVMLAIMSARPLHEPVTFPQSKIDTTSHPRVYVAGVLVIAATVALYVLFW